MSYNGKSFDLPMLEARYILSRSRPTFRQLPHLDLLHPNRRLFKGQFESHRLPMMEQELLGFEREQDCPSSEVPERYFRFQRSGDPTHILPVLRHNAWDVISLVALAAHLAAVVDGAEFPFQASRAADYAGDSESALRHTEAAIETALSRPQRLEAMERAARTNRKLGRFEEAAGWWQRLLEEPRARRITPYVELAKLCEHQLRDRPRALSLTDTAIDMVRRGLLPQGTPGGETTLEGLLHRRARLARPG